MVEPILTKEGQEVLDTLVYRRLPIVRENRKEEYFHMISLLMSAQGVKEAGKELVIETVIGTWGYPSPDTYDFVTENIINILSYSRKIVTVEALSACGLSGMFNGLDEKGKAMILRYPKELEKAYQAGKALVAG